MKARAFIPAPQATGQLAGDSQCAIYRNEKGQRLKWSAPFPLPAVGDRVEIVMNRIGTAEVVGYFEEAGFVGVMTRPEHPPEWLRRQNEEAATEPGAAWWVKDGIGFEFGAEIRLTAPVAA